MKGTFSSIKDVLSALRFVLIKILTYPNITIINNLREEITTLERSIEDEEGKIADLSQELEDERTAMNSSNEILSAAKVIVINVIYFKSHLI